MGLLLLEGGREFHRGMAAADERALTAGGKRSAAVRIIPAAAAPDRNDQRAGANAVAWFQGLGAQDVSCLPIIDRASAEEEELARELERAGFIFMLGGFARYLAETLCGSRAGEALKTARGSGAVIGGSSAGAMVLCEWCFDPALGEVLGGLNFVSNACLLPHHNTFGRDWAPQLAERIPGAALIGIDEETGMLNDGPRGQWTVYGKGMVTIYAAGASRRAGHGQKIVLPEATGRP